MTSIHEDLIRLELKTVKAFFVKGQSVTRTFEYNLNGQLVGVIGIETFYEAAVEDGIYMNLQYKFGNNEIRKQFIALESKPSNLGVGSVLYFCCPETGELCRTLYLNPSTFQFHSREYFQKFRYRNQLLSKYNYIRKRTQIVEAEIELIENSGKRFSYSDKETRTAKRYKRLSGELERLDRKLILSF